MQFSCLSNVNRLGRSRFLQTDIGVKLTWRLCEASTGTLVSRARIEKVDEQHELAIEAKSGKHADAALQSLKVLLAFCVHMMLYCQKKPLSFPREEDDIP